MINGRGVTLDLWQRQAVLAAAAFLRERFQGTADARAKLVHDALLEVVEPKRRGLRIQREMSKAADAAVLTARTERRAHQRDRRSGGSDRRVVDLGSPTGVERRRGARRARSERRTSR